MHYSPKFLVGSLLALGLLISPLVVNAQGEPLAFVTPLGLPQATQGQAFDLALQVSGGTAPYTFETSLLGQPLPQWLSLSPAGQLTGTAETGQFTFTVIVRDNDGNDQTNLSADFTLAVVPAVPPAQLTITVGGDLNARNGVVGQVLPLNVGVTVSGGVPNYTWTNAGALPTGIALVPVNPDGSFMSIQGIPTEAGEFTFTLTVTDSSQPALSVTTEPLTFTITAAPVQPPAEPPVGEQPPVEPPAPPAPPLAPQAQPFQFTATIFSGLIGTWNCTIDINGALTEVLPTSTCQNAELVGQDLLLGANGDILFDQGAITIESAANGIYNLKGFAKIRGPLAAADDEALKIYFDRSDNPVSLRPAAGQGNQNNALLEGLVTSGYFGEAMLTSGAQALAVCGDFQIGIGEQCDDGNQNNFDLCSNMCRDQGILPPGISGLPYMVRLEQFYNVITAFAAFPFIALEGEAGFMTQGSAVTGNYEGTLTTNQGNIIPTVWNVLPENNLRLPAGREKTEFIMEMVQKVKDGELTFTGEEMVDILYVIHAVNTLPPALPIEQVLP